MDECGVWTRFNQIDCEEKRRPKKKNAEQIKLVIYLIFMVFTIDAILVSVLM